MNDTVIIARPHRQSTTQRTIYASLTAFAWFGWFYLWLPLVTLAAWAAGIGVAQEELARDERVHGLADLKLLLMLFVVCVVCLVGWAAYNHARFRNTERRRLVRDAAPEAIALHFDADELVSRRLRRSRRTVLHLDPHGRPVRAVIDPPHRARGAAVPAVVAGACTG
jgi:biofilm PGA synthesis protein PgaD